MRAGRRPAVPGEVAGRPDPQQIAAADGDLYERDFLGWAERQAALARAGRADLLDLDHIAEELEGLSRSEQATLRSSYRVLLLHLLKWRYQPERRSDSWANTIGRERDNVEVQLEDSPGLKPRREALFARAYRLARREAARDGAADRDLPGRMPVHAGAGHGRRLLAGGGGRGRRRPFAVIGHRPCSARSTR